MPGPFPGMDPYLETPHFWHGFHNSLITYIEGALNAGLPPGLAANAEERVYITPPRRVVIPDISLTQTESRPAAPASSRTAVLEADPSHGVLIAYPERDSEMFVEIRSVENWEEIITIIEVLSPTNKTSGIAGQETYLQKQEEVLRSSTSLLEIDLLRGGAHTAAAPYEMLRNLGTWDCLICLHRAAQRYHYEYWFNRLCDPLPTIKVPLTSDLPDFELDLQAVFQQAYDAGPYRRRVDYRQEPPLPMDAETASWADRLLHEQGYR